MDACYSWFTKYMLEGHFALLYFEAVYLKRANPHAYPCRCVRQKLVLKFTVTCVKGPVLSHLSLEVRIFVKLYDGQD